MQTTPFILEYYTDATGEKPFRKWLYGLRDRAAIARVVTRLERIELGNLGDHDSVGNGVMELLIHYGPGYRVYYAFSGNQIVLLLVGGDKSSQKKDIQTAHAYWEDHQEKKK